MDNNCDGSIDERVVDESTFGDFVNDMFGGTPVSGDEREGGDEVDVLVCAEFEDTAEDFWGDCVDEGGGGEEVQAVQAETGELVFEGVDLGVNFDD